MARSDLIIDLVKAGMSGNPDAVRSTASNIAAEERSKRHIGVADRIDRALRNATAHPSIPRTNMKSRDNNGLHREYPDRPLSSLYLNPVVRTALDEFVEEQRRADLLRAHGLEPRHRLLLSGPPGNGKTSLAECLATELALPLLSVRYDAVVTSYLGETAQRLRRLFDFVKTEPCVLFFDEFDALGKERGDVHETGEIKRVVTALLLQMDDLPSYCVLVGATNHPELLDRATWRRFELRLAIDRPDDSQLLKFFADQIATFDRKPGYTAQRLLEAVRPASFSEAERFFDGARRHAVLDQGRHGLRSVFNRRVKAWQAEAAMKTGEARHDGSSDIATT